MFLTRREFVAKAGLVIGGTTLGARVLRASEIGEHTGESVLSNGIAPGHLRELAAIAIDAARKSGADAADGRFSYHQVLRIRIDGGGSPSVSAGTRFACGVRAYVGGSTAFNYGNVPEADSVASTARNAVTDAKGFQSIFQNASTTSSTRALLAPASVVQGEWHSPMEIDPFRVPIMEQAALLGALKSAADIRVDGRPVPGGEFEWERETRVCATMDGTFITQTFVRAMPWLLVDSQEWLNEARLSFRFVPMLGGYELFTGAELQERFKSYAPEVMKIARLPERAIDVGRYPVVLDGESAATLLTSTLSAALELDRATGSEANAAGGSFLSPPDQILGTQQLAPTLNVTAGRPVPHITGVKWDDEGVVPSSVKVVEQGRVMDYATDRQRAPILEKWYTQRGLPVKSNGFSIASAADRLPVIGNSHLAIAPGPSSSSLNDLVKDVKHGVLVLQVRQVRADQQLASGLMHGGNILEIRNGEIVSKVTGNALQFSTSAFWKGVTGVGDATTIGSGFTSFQKGQPWQQVMATGESPALRASSIDVIPVVRG